MKKILFTLLLGGFLFGQFANTVCVAQVDSPIVLTHNQRKIATFVLKFMEFFHYSNIKFGDEMSQKALNQYLKMLDPNRMFFLQSEIDDIQEKYAKKIDDLVAYAGDIRLAFKLNQRMLERVKSYEKYACNLMNSKIVLNTNEVVEMDRKKESWPATKEEMEDLWRKRTLNDLLILRLVSRQRVEEGNKSDSAIHVSWNAISDEERVKKRIRQMINYLTARTPEDIAEMFLSSLTTVFDPHSSYMSPVSEADFQMQMGLELIGIGAELNVEDGYIKVNRLIPGGPADKSGLLKVSDRIIAIAEEDKEPIDLVDMPLDKAVNHIRGKENTVAVITILDGSLGLASTPKVIRIVRKKVELKDSEVSAITKDIKLKDGKTIRVGVVTVPSFYHNFDSNNSNPKRVFTDMKKIVDELTNDSKINALIVDMRSNGGGALDDAIRMCAMFVPEGTMVQIRDKQNNVLPQRVKNDKADFDGPMVVMVNKFAASATEIFAAAMQDHKRAIIVGDKQTHGKGTVQDVRSLDAYAAQMKIKPPAGSLKFTTAKFYRPNGESTQLRGVVPDIIFPSFTDAIESSESELDYALPFDTIPSQHLYASIPNYKGVVEKLKKSSMQRIQTDTAFKALQEQIDVFKKLKDKKVFSLNEEERWNEFKQEKALIDQQVKLMKLTKADLGEDSTKGDESSKKDDDIYLNEALKITKDLYETLNK